MRVAWIVSRVKLKCPSFVSVGHALTSNADVPTPSVLIAPAKLMAMPEGLIGDAIHSQMITSVFSLYIQLKRAQDVPFEAGPGDLFDNLVAELRAALCGWTPNASIYAPMNLHGGELDRWHPGVACWREDYSTQYELRITPT